MIQGKRYLTRTSSHFALRHFSLIHYWEKAMIATLEKIVENGYVISDLVRKSANGQTYIVKDGSKDIQIPWWAVARLLKITYHLDGTPISKRYAF